MPRLEPICILLDNFFTAEIDRAAKIEKLDRAAFITKAVTKYLVEHHGKEKPKEPVHQYHGLDFFEG
jgi:metal-responsive CopG/Arc/MetJ family transcriptional regulator